MNGFNFGYSKEPHIWMDPRSKAIMLICVCAVAFENTNFIVDVCLVAFLALTLINSRMYGRAIKYTILFLVTKLIFFLTVTYIEGLPGVILSTITTVILVYIPIIMVAIYLFTTTTVSEFVASFKKMRLSQKLSIPFAIMFRFFPTIGEEWNNIQNAMRFRGINLTLGHFITKPLKTVEYTLVPLLMSSAKIANELSAASLSRGLDSDSERSCITQIKFGVLDYFVSVLSLCFLYFSFCL